MEKYRIGADRLAEQLIGLSATDLTIENYPSFLAQRARALAEAANAYMATLADLS
jgi:hypothetical protein